MPAPATIPERTSEAAVPSAGTDRWQLGAVGNKSFATGPDQQNYTHVQQLQQWLQAQQARHV